MFWRDVHRAKRFIAGVLRPPVVHRHPIKAYDSKGFTRGIDFFQVSAKGFFSIINAAEDLESRSREAVLFRARAWGSLEQDFRLEWLITASRV